MHTHKGFPGTVVKTHLPVQETWDTGSVPGLGRPPGGGHGNPLQYSCLENPPWTEEPGGLQPLWLQRVAHNWSDLANTHTHTHINVYTHTHTYIHTHTHTHIYICTHTHIKKGFPCSSAGKETACSVGDLGLIPGSRRSLGGRHGNPLQYSYLENSMDRGTWRATVHRVTQCWISLKWLGMHTHTHTSKPPHLLLSPAPGNHWFDFFSYAFAFTKWPM